MVSREACEEDDCVCLRYAVLKRYVFSGIFLETLREVNEYSRGRKVRRAIENVVRQGMSCAEIVRGSKTLEYLSCGRKVKWIIGWSMIFAI